jgi:hypothetical protein
MLRRFSTASSGLISRLPIPIKNIYSDPLIYSPAAPSPYALISDSQPIKSLSFRYDIVSQKFGVGRRKETVQREIKLALFCKNLENLAESVKNTVIGKRPQYGRTRSESARLRWAAGISYLSKFCFVAKLSSQSGIESEDGTDLAYRIQKVEITV